MGFLEYLFGPKPEPVRTWVCTSSGRNTIVRVYRKGAGYRVTQEGSDGKEGQPLWELPFMRLTYSTIRSCYAGLVTSYKMMATVSYDLKHPICQNVCIQESLPGGALQKVGEIDTNESRAISTLFMDPETGVSLNPPVTEVLVVAEPLTASAHRRDESAPRKGEERPVDISFMRGKDGRPSGSITRLPDGRNVISVGRDADIVTSFLTLSMLFSDGMPDSKKCVIARWAGLEEDQWGAAHREACGAADLNYLLELKRCGRSIPKVAQGIVEYMNESNVPALPTPLNDDVRGIFEGIYAALDSLSP